MSIRALVFCLLLSLSAFADVLSFQPGEVSTAVKGVLVADQTRTYTFSGKAGQPFELALRSDHGPWLLVHVRDPNGRDVFNNYKSGELRARGVLPQDGDYTVQLALRRAELQRERRTPYQLTLTVHALPDMVPIEDGEGELFVTDGSGSRQVEQVLIGLGEGGDVQVTMVFAEGDNLVVKGTWRGQTDEAALLRLTEVAGQPARGRGLVLFADEIADDGPPTHVMLRFDALGNEGAHYTLFYGRD